MSQREILFKAKRIDNGEWVEGFPYYGDYSGAFILQNKSVKRRNARTSEITLGDEVFPIEVDGRTYCQYTELTDKNGKKIFEGDILSYNGSKETVVYDTSLRIPCFTTGIGSGSSTAPHPYKLSVHHVVIGNIHDN